MRAGRNLLDIRDQNRSLAHLRDAASHFVGAPARSLVPDWDGGIRTITLGGPWKNREAEKIKTAWGVPPQFDDLAALVHFYAGGWGVFDLPAAPTVYAFISKAAKHPDAITYLVLLAEVALHSRLTLSEALGLVLDCAALDPLQDDHPRASATEWARVGIHAVNVWQKRAQDGGAGVGDEPMCLARIHQMKAILASRHIAQAELDLADAKRRWAA